MDESKRRIPSSARTIRASRLPKGPNGRALCRRCQKEVPPNRKTFCGKLCIDVWNLDRDPTLQRKIIFKRDKGICKECGINTEQLRERWDLDPNPEEAKEMGFTKKHLFEIDHLLEVIFSGGGNFNENNLQTLCVPCHQKKTSLLARQRAWLRKLASGLITMGETLKPQ